ncbi:MAG: bifunctional (p)ppGpp synthetase/guanosine-3',5'-bis(diphosphate) 3'-pyrophosphohydrolase [Nitrospinae bacterium]|nr:bifunctional (p)ppGpp synthetase/guanosine-3',5'-bis(diphosphate) 3'-pyrophosphohydrolase [Nitrospinota bacterium]
MVRVEDITESILSYNPDANVDIIWKAYVYSAKVHRGQVRLSGEPYLSHPLEVAHILTKLKMDESCVAAGLLHDTIEDTISTSEEIREHFGEEIFSLVDGVTKISKIEFASSEEQQAENYRKMILAMAKDIRVILIKLADRLHNMRTLEYMSGDKREKISRETLDIFAPLANRLGIGWMKLELEDPAFKYLYPDKYKEIMDRVAEKYEERVKFIEEIAIVINKELDKADVKGKVMGRPKHYYSIYKKMIDQSISFDQVFDITGLRIITDTVKDCYSILGIIHSIWKPIHGKIKDYIAMPKANMYQSLHTTVIVPPSNRVEFQIRTEEMHRIAENGIAAHWRYKEVSKKDEKAAKVDERFAWLKHILEWQKDMKDPKEFLETMKIDLFPDEVYVFTPKGKVISFPKGATPIDFAYYIHTDVGDKCVGAKVNRKIVPLKYNLSNGDIIEILTSPAHKPSRDWLKIVKTSRARTKIRNYLKIEEKARSITLGREITEKEIQKYNLSPSEVLKPEALSEAIKTTGFSNEENLFAAIGYGRYHVHQLMMKLIPPEKIEERKKREESRFKKIISRVTKKPEIGSVKIKGVEDFLTRFAMCCNPVPGDKIIGFISRGRGVTIHTADCPNIAELQYDKDRLVTVEWDLKEKTLHKVRINIHTLDKPGILADISASIASQGVNISQADIETTENKEAFLNFSIEISDLDQLQKVINSIKKLKGVLKVERVKEYKKLKRAASGK